jgi:hypothetical protein
VPESPPFKVISTDAVAKAVEKAEHYRLLNDPEQAESICLDVLAVAPDHQIALRVLLLAMTDQFGTPRVPRTSRGPGPSSPGSPTSTSGPTTPG